MNAVWIVIGVGLFGAIVRAIGWSHAQSRAPELGSVSNQWIAEHRLSQNEDRLR